MMQRVLSRSLRPHAPLPLALRGATHLVIATVLLTHGGGCKSSDEGGGFPPDPASRFEEPALPDGAVSSNGVFDFVPGPAGAAPGYSVLAETEGNVFEAPEVEILLNPYEPERQVAVQALNADAPRPIGSQNPDAWAPRSDAIPTEQRLDASPEPIVWQFAHPATPLARPNTDAVARLLAAIESRPADAHGAPSFRIDANDPDDDGVPQTDGPPCTGEDDDPSDCSDNCPLVGNADQYDEDGDGIGNTCQDDFDGDGILNDGDDSGTAGDAPCTGGTREACDDNCPNVPNVRQRDQDGDGIGDLCDPDLDGNGVPDETEETDWDGDGVPSAIERGRDTDGDGIPDDKDADDDNDGIGTREENDGTPGEGADTDGDGVPDSRDNDADGDGIPDRYEGNRDSDGDGTPDHRDTDDDGDGSPTADEIGPADRDPNGNLRPRWLDPSEDANTESCTDRRAFHQYPDIPSFNAEGATLHFVSPWIAQTYSFELFGASYSYAWVLHPAPDGLYLSLQSGVGYGVPPDVAGLGIGTGFGMIRPPAPDVSVLTASTVEGYSVSLSISLFGISFGFTLFHNEAWLPHRAIQFDAGVGFSTGAGLTLPIGGVDIGLAFAKGEMAIRGGSLDQPMFMMIFPINPPCGARQKDTGAVSFADFVAELQSLDATTFEGALAQNIGASLAPLAEHITAPGSPPAENIPASSNGAWVDAFVRQPDTSPCPTCPNTSLDGILYDTLQRMYEAGESTAALQAAAIDSLLQYNDVAPDRAGMDLAADFSVGAIDAGFALGYSNRARANGLPFRYTSDDVVLLEAAVGDVIPLRLGADEIAALLPSATAADIENATVCIQSEFSGPRASASCGRVFDGALEATYTMTDATSLLLEFLVDLTTADGTFNDAPVERWLVRPALRQIRSVAGPAAQLLVNAPQAVPSGAPVTISATVVDEGGLTVASPTTFRFFAPDGSLIEEIVAERGAASVQVVPTPVAPSLTSLRLVTATFGDGEQADALLAVGDGLSRHGDVIVRGTSLRDAGFEVVAISSSEVLWFAPEEGATLPEAGEASARYANPGDFATTAQTFTIEDERP